MRLASAATAFLLVTLSGLFAQTIPPGVQKKSTIGGITEYIFPNGLRVLLFPNPANPKITVNVTYLVGSRHEGYGESGMAHLLEHLNFIETTSGRMIKNEIVGRGAAWNGTASNDRTN
jgi:zinc protease